MNLDLAPHIYTLLYQQDTVIFPNFGGLVSSYSPASIDYVQGIIYPPSKTIVLNDRLLANDGVLEHFVRTKFELTGEEACEAIESFVQGMEEALDKGEIVLFPKVGRIYKNYERKLQFLQESTNFNKETHGLPSVHFYPILRASEGTPFSDATKPIAHPKMVGKPRTFGKMLQAAMPVLVGLAVVSISISLYFLRPVQDSNGLAGNQTVGQPTPQKINQSRDRDTEHASILGGNNTFQDEFPEPPEIEINETIVEVEAVEEKVIETESASLAPTTKDCIIIIGAFKQKSGVRSTIEKIYALGYDAYQDKKSGLNRVGVQLAYNDDKDIDRALRLVRKKINKKAWVFKK